MIKQYDSVQLKSPANPSLIDSTGVVVDVLSENPPFYTVEFINSDGSTRALLDLAAEDLILLSSYTPAPATTVSQYSRAAAVWKKLKQIVAKR
ncbi:DUF4926 domain-containing protein [Parasedimentitalea maritima]|uniref:DUF4926 domain-containing protein n=1 Tax=Parasedimentitalea maritima TaxID=2578117 RepID=A0ABY2UTQ4_9RHOB|nr:DUF4926 domain-containing protein [Zongyanglinia marina]TLP59279.1 DUF4926 domain-containing protein [Zongyanglinia marina]